MKTPRLDRLAPLAALLLCGSPCMAQLSAAHGLVAHSTAGKPMLRRIARPHAVFARRGRDVWHLPLVVGRGATLSLVPARAALRLEMAAHRSLTLAPRQGGLALTYRAHW
jgi:hypothetical protein